MCNKMNHLGITIVEILGYKKGNKRHAELQETLNRNIRIQKGYEAGQWIDRNEIKAWFLPDPYISYERYTELKANIGSRREYLHRLHMQNKWLKNEIKKACREYSLNTQNNESNRNT